MGWKIKKEYVINPLGGRDDPKSRFVKLMQPNPMSLVKVWLFLLLYGETEWF